VLRASDAQVADCGENGLRRSREGGHDEDAPKDGEPGQQHAEVVAGGGEDRIGGVAVAAIEDLAPMRCSPMASPMIAARRSSRGAGRA